MWSNERVALAAFDRAGIGAAAPHTGRPAPPGSPRPGWIKKLIEHLDALAERTGHSTGFRLTLAAHMALPHLEERHWEQMPARHEDRVVDRRFLDIMHRTLTDDAD